MVSLMKTYKLMKKLLKNNFLSFICRTKKPLKGGFFYNCPNICRTKNRPSTVFCFKEMICYYQQRFLVESLPVKSG